jgi:hypothetical protein
MRGRRVVDDDYVDDSAVVREPATNIIARVIWFIYGIIFILLGFRFLLSLLGANRGNGFANFIYDTSHPLVAPFFGLFHYNVVNYGVSHFEVYTLVAILVYAAIAWILAYLFTIPGRRVY